MYLYFSQTSVNIIVIMGLNAFFDNLEFCDRQIDQMQTLSQSSRAAHTEHPSETVRESLLGGFSRPLSIERPRYPTVPLMVCESV